MATSARTIDFLLGQLSALKDVRAQKMFGEYALYIGLKLFALVCDDQLFVKVTAPGKALLGVRYREGTPYPGAKPSILVTASDLEDPEALVELVRITAAALPLPKPKPASKKAKPKTVKARR